MSNDIYLYGHDESRENIERILSDLRNKFGTTRMYTELLSSKHSTEFSKTGQNVERSLLTWAIRCGDHSDMCNAHLEIEIGLQGGDYRMVAVPDDFQRGLL